MRNKANFRRYADPEIGVPRGQNVRNKANFEEPGRDPEARSRETKLNLGRMGYLVDGDSEGCQTCETNPILAGRPGSRGSVAQNKAKFRRADTPPFHYSSIPSPSLSCETNPIFAAMPIRRSAFPGEKTCGTKPIWTGAELELSHLQERSYVACACLIGCAKQSQFPCETDAPPFQDSELKGIVQNKANFHPDADREIGVPGGPLCETKPRRR